MANKIIKAINKIAVKTGAKRPFAKKTANIQDTELKKWAECAGKIEKAAKNIGHSKLEQKSRALKMFIKTIENKIKEEGTAQKNPVSLPLFISKRNDYLNDLKYQLKEMTAIISSIAQTVNAASTFTFDLTGFNNAVTNIQNNGQT